MKSHQEPKPGEVRTEQVNALRVGMSCDKVARMLGLPRVTHGSSAYTGVSEKTDEGVSSIFEFDDEEFDQVWEYGHPIRKRLTFLVGFRRSALVVSWRMTFTTE